MASKFLTNTALENSLSGRVRALAKASAKLDFLVGYFFFSGFCEIHENLAQKPLRILIGMDAQVDLNNCIFEYATIGEKSTFSKNQIKERYFENLKNAISSKADLLDTKDFEASYRVFVQKLEDGTLEVRKTREANHAKMYLFSIPVKNFSQGQRNMADFMKQLLVRRFESSKFSFIKSLQNIKNSVSLLRRWFVELNSFCAFLKNQVPQKSEDFCGT